jgi:hypothetical protein
MISLNYTNHFDFHLLTTKKTIKIKRNNHMSKWTPEQIEDGERDNFRNTAFELHQENERLKEENERLKKDAIMWCNRASENASQVYEAYQVIEEFQSEAETSKARIKELEQQLHCKDDLVTGDNNSISDIGDAPLPPSATDGNSIEQEYQGFHCISCGGPVSNWTVCDNCWDEVPKYLKIQLKQSI